MTGASHQVTAVTDTDAFPCGHAWGWLLRWQGVAERVHRCDGEEEGDRGAEQQRQDGHECRLCVRRDVAGVVTQVLFFWRAARISMAVVRTAVLGISLLKVMGDECSGGGDVTTPRNAEDPACPADQATLVEPLQRTQ